MTVTPNTTAKRKPGRPRKQRQPGTQSNQEKQDANPEQENPFSAQLKASRESYDSTKQSARNPKTPQLTVIDGGIASSPEPNASKATRENTTTRLTASNASGQTSLAGASLGESKLGLGTSTLPPLPEPRARGTLINAHEYVNSLAPELIEQWATSWLATGNRRRWMCDMQPAIGRENDRYKADLVHELERHPVAIETLAQLKAEQVMSDLERRKLLKEIANGAEHPMRGHGDRLKAIELDARHDPESMMSKGSNQQQAQALPAVNLFFLPASAARPSQLVEQQAQALDV